IYYGRIESVPEYFKKRFSTGTRPVVTLILLLYLIGYVGINFLTLGTAMHALTGWPVFGAACGAATATAIYVAAGGQTSVIMTDLAQGLILLVVGLGLFGVGVYNVGGFGEFWGLLPDAHRTALANLNHPDSFHTMGVFWQDAMAGGIAFYFMNQGILMRFMSARSVDEGRKAIAMVALIVMPLAAISVSGVGSIGRALAEKGAIFQGTELAMIEPDNIFVIVTNILTTPGVFGLVMAALTAALMSTADTLLTAVSAIVVNDIWRPLAGETEDATDLKVGRFATVGAAAVGVVLVPVFNTFESIYVAHATFTAAIVPPMAVTLVLGALWPRFGSRAALVTLIGGSAAIVASVIEPAMIEPISQGVEPAGEGADKYNYMRALFGLLTSAGLGVTAAGFFEPDEEPDPLLVAGPEEETKAAFKGGPVKEGGTRVDLTVESVDEEAETKPGTDEALVRLHPGDLDTLGAEAGDLIHVAAPGVWHGGLLSVQARVADGEADSRGRIEIADELLRAAGLADEGDAVVRLVG
ncbi:MAG: sodium:solute symporter, partial [Bradymonadaceae bacterium]